MVQDHTASKRRVEDIWEEEKKNCSLNIKKVIKIEHIM